jgi:UDP-N-acetylglucosamine:LPS N-acetylglucosamine transferase
MKIALVCANGGHFVEMLQLMEAFDSYKFFFITFRGSDTTALNNAYRFTDYKNILIKFIVLFCSGWYILLKEKPKAVISTGGGGIAVPFCIIAKCLGMKIVYIESFTRIKKSTRGGRFIYLIADLFLVQWESQLAMYGRKARYWGGVS